ncbi:hypothetical protein [Roseibium sediminicola]|uniref:Uncharacterized protein n=1 Tax=Roseibium sediminicola TaxID=2933272 RepID=A0ABT0GQ53_9HYPH|nr:hypothetical protein [Roseibium sp. CAU 1639]MCK7611549.1 hypothetical protein [Roseibium sp. CAU 1639]
MITAISCVLVRLFALYVFMQNVYFLPLVLFNVANLLGFLTTAMNLTICIILFFKPRVILFGMDFSNSTAPDTSETGTANMLQSAGVAILGLYFLLSGLRSALNFYFLWSDARFQSNVFNNADFWSSVVSVAGGFLLIVASGGISNLITWLRQLGPRIEES